MTTRSRLAWWSISLLLPSMAWGQQQLRVFILAGQSNMEGVAKMEHLDELVNDPLTRDKYLHLINPDGSWRVRDDVTLVFNNNKGGLTTGQGVVSATFGPELQFGQVVGDYFSDPVLLIKTARGGTSLAVDWRPPSSGIPTAEEGYSNCGGRLCSASEYGLWYRQMIADVIDVVLNLDIILPQYAGFQPVLSGFVWFQGFNDSLDPRKIGEYEVNLSNLIRDVRDELDAPDLPIIIGEMGQNGPYTKNPRHLAIRQAQRNVAESLEFADSTTFVVTTRYVYPDRPRFDGEFHYWGRADTIIEIGHQFGQAAIQEIFPTPTTGFPTFAPTGFPSFSPSSNKPSGQPSSINPSMNPSESPSAFPTPTDGYCGDDLTVGFYVPDLDECHSCIWLKARPNYQATFCDPNFEFSALDICEETCGKCRKAVCDDDRDARIFSSHSAHPSGAFYICEETCGKCTDSCEDTSGIFSYENRTYNCGFLQLRPSFQDTVCVANNTATIVCPETCNTCDALPVGKPVFESTVGITDPLEIGRECPGAPSASPSQSIKPSDVPSDRPSTSPVPTVSSIPSSRPSVSDKPSGSSSPSSKPSISFEPTRSPSSRPSVSPTDSVAPSAKPSLSVGPTVSFEPSVSMKP